MIEFKCGILFIFKLIIHQHGTRARDEIRLIRRKSMSIRQKSSKMGTDFDWSRVKFENQ